MVKYIGIRFAGVLAVFLSAVLVSCATSNPRSPAQDGLTGSGIDALVASVMKDYNVAGMAVAVVKDGTVIHEKGYGFRDINGPERISPTTIFKIASNSKAFTTAAIARLVDDGLLSWDDAVVDILPEFKMYDPYVTREFTVRDLLTHRSGLGTGSGDLMLWPEPNQFTRTDIIRAQRHFKPATSFRSAYSYDNTLYVVAGEIVSKISSLSFEEYVDSKIMEPIGLETCFAGQVPDSVLANAAKPHSLADSGLYIVDRGIINNEPVTSVAAGGIRCSLHDMIDWVQTHMAGGIAPNGARIFSSAQSQEMWRPHTLIPLTDRRREMDSSNFYAYALGWRVADTHGHFKVSHTGALAGFRSVVEIIPSLDLAVIVLLNTGNSDARRAVATTILQSYMDIAQQDWVSLLKPDRTEPDEQSGVGSANIVPGRVDFSRDHYAGTYSDPWFGEVDISVNRDTGALDIVSRKSPKLDGVLIPLRDNMFAVYWHDRSLEGDAFIHFELDPDNRVTGARMARMYPDQDTSFNYQDLNFMKIDKRD